MLEVRSKKKEVRDGRRQMGGSGEQKGRLKLTRAAGKEKA
jgi:hypothetical protein